ncbi:hypothetical protein [Saccharopolyspora gregorii]|uniref:Uncharacterized protein n=1 Tax=Saccharopolyspora gregorii TaxID=33914 RepID=A0ABP6RMN9_9PSEU
MLQYRTLLHFEQGHHDVPELVREQLHSWLRKHKRLDADALRPNEVARLGEDTEGILLEQRRQDGSFAQRTRITERKPNGVWRSHLTLLVPSPEEPAIVWFDVVNPDRAGDADEERRWAGTPKVVRELLGIVPAHDGMAKLADRPQVVGIDDVPELVDVVRDGKRRVPVYLAGSAPDLPRHPWLEMVASLLAETVSIGAGYVLDAEATELFAEIVGPNHAVQPGTMRTFLPGADPADGADGLRHRVLGTQRLVEDPAGRLRRLLGWRARDMAIEAPLPSVLRRLDRSFGQQLDELVIGERAPEPVAQPTELEPARPLRPVQTQDRPLPIRPAAPVLDEADRIALQIGRALRAEYGDLDLDRAREMINLARHGERERQQRRVISERLNELREAASTLQEENEALNARLDQSLFDEALTYEDLNKAEARVRHLQSRLHDAGQYADAWSQPEPEAPAPSSLSVLLKQVDTLERVEFTWNEEDIFKLAEHDRMDSWAAKVWNALLALQDYARVVADGEHPSGVEGYLNNLPAGCRGYPANRHARDESEDVRTNRKFWSRRMFPVPNSLDPDGQVFMGAHFKIANSRMVSPRMHYYDATARDGKVYVGYLGRHLPTQQTN